MAGWSGLEKDLLESIFERLENDIMDCLGFSGVCTQWRQIAMEKGRHALPRIMLMPHDYNGELNSNCNSLFSLSCASNQYKSRVQDMQGKRCCGSFNGLLIVVGSKLGDIHLVNPVSGSQVALPTPSVLMVENQETGPINKIRVFLNPSSDDDYVVIVICSPSKSAYLWKNYAKSWSKFGIENGRIIDVSCFNSKLFAITMNGNIEVFDLQTPSSWKSMIRTRQSDLIDVQLGALLIRRFANVKQIQAPRRYGVNGIINRVYLVESSEQQLFVIIRYVVYNRLPITVGFKVFNFVEGAGEWNEAKSLSDRVVFVGLNSLCMLAHDVPECKANSIYFTGPHDTGMFNMEDQSISLLDFSHPIPHSPNTWFAPNLRQRGV